MRLFLLFVRQRNSVGLAATLLTVLIVCHQMAHSGLSDDLLSRVLLALVAVPTFIACVTSMAFKSFSPELEATLPVRIVHVRVIHLVLVLLTAFSTVWITSEFWNLVSVSDSIWLRNLAFLTGIATLSITCLDPRACWIPVLGISALCSFGILMNTNATSNVHDALNLASWWEVTIQPIHSISGWIIAFAALAAGLSVYVLRGPHAVEPSLD